MHPLLKPRWLIGHLLVAVTIFSFVNLGMWQLRRHDEKSELRATVAAAIAATPVDIASAEGPFTRVTATGEFEVDNQTKVLRGQSGVSGYHVLTVFRLIDGSGVLVDRGWVSLDAVLPPPPARVMSIVGILWPAEPGASIPDSLLPAVRRIDPEIQEAFTTTELRDEYLLLESTSLTTPDDPVLGESPEIDLGPHLSYAVQWFLFTAVVVVGYPILLTKRRISTVPGRGSASA